MVLINILLSIFLLPSQVFASEPFIETTMEEVAQHSTPDDCWMVYGGKVYDFSEYLPNHDKFMDIREWCGMDMTEDFETKAGVGRDHREGSYAMLEEYYIGDLVLSEVEEETIEEVVVPIEEGEVERRVNPYHFLPIFFGTLVIYWISYFLSKKKIKRFNAFWNTVLLFTFLIPSFGFGLYIILSYTFTDLRNYDFDFLYWHVELSIAMSAIALSHFIQRYKQYLVQLKK